MSELKTYVRNFPFYVKARQLEEGEIAYDGHGQAIPFQPGDYLIVLETDSYTLSQGLFEKLYREVEHNANGKHENISQTEPPDLRER